MKWENTYGDNGEDGFNMIQQTIKNGYIAVGHSSSFFSKGKNDVFITRIDPRKKSGKTIWVGKRMIGVCDISMLR